MNPRIARTLSGEWDVWEYSPVLKMHLRRGEHFSTRDAARLSIGQKVGKRQ